MTAVVSIISSMGSIIGRMVVWDERTGFKASLSMHCTLLYNTQLYLFDSISVFTLHVISPFKDQGSV